MEARSLNRAHVITVSDGVSAGVREDVSGPALIAMLKDAGFDATGPQVVPDEEEQIRAALLEAVMDDASVIVTTGGTGLGPRDVTPQATSALIDYEVPGLGELMRRTGGEKTPTAALSRSLAGVRGQTLILNLPGSRTGATESLGAVVPALRHAIELLHGHTKHDRA